MDNEPEPVLRAVVRYFTTRGFDVEAISSPRGCLERVKQGLGNIDCVLVHKDLGVHTRNRADWSFSVTSDRVITAIHEEAPYVRVGVVSGEYPDGRAHVLEMGADFYIETTDMTNHWTLDQLRKGWVPQEEQQRRGQTVEQPREERWGRGTERF